MLASAYKLRCNPSLVTNNSLLKRLQQNSTKYKKQMYQVYKAYVKSTKSCTLYNSLTSPCRGYQLSGLGVLVGKYYWGSKIKSN
jgi:hypothetical protein